MSAFTIIITPEHAVCASDTLSYRKNKDQPMITAGYKCKTHILPCYKAFAVVVGYTHLAVDFMSFVNLRAISSNLDDLTISIKEHFLSTINLDNYLYTGTEGMDDSTLGDIQIVTYDHSLRSFVKYLVEVDRDIISVNKEVCSLEPNERIILQHPKISKDRLTEIEASATTLNGLAVEIIKQMFTDSLLEETQSVGLGGEIIITALAANPVISITQYVAHEFPDLNIYHNEIKPRLNKYRGTEHFRSMEKILSRKLDISIGRSIATHKIIVEDEISWLEATINPMDSQKAIFLDAEKSNKCLLGKMNVEQPKELLLA